MSADIRYQPKSKDLKDAVYFPSEDPEQRQMLIKIIDQKIISLQNNEEADRAE